MGECGRGGVGIFFHVGFKESQFNDNSTFARVSAFHWSLASSRLPSPSPPHTLPSPHQRFALGRERVGNCYPKHLFGWSSQKIWVWFALGEANFFAIPKSPTPFWAWAESTVSWIFFLCVCVCVKSALQNQRSWHLQFSAVWASHPFVSNPISRSKYSEKSCSTLSDTRSFPTKINIVEITLAVKCVSQSWREREFVFGLYVSISWLDMRSSSDKFLCSLSRRRYSTWHEVSKLSACTFRRWRKCSDPFRAYTFSHPPGPRGGVEVATCCPKKATKSGRMMRRGLR